MKRQSKSISLKSVMSTKDRKAAESAWKMFHKRNEVDGSTKLEGDIWPQAWAYAGRCVTTYYTSDKWQRDRKFFERYYHDHDKDTGIWLPKGSEKWLDAKHTVPDFKIPGSVAILGYTLSFDIIQHDSKALHAKKGKVIPEQGSLLVVGPTKKHIFVVENGRIVAMVWGPKMKVEARGIVG